MLHFQLQFTCMLLSVLIMKIILKGNQTKWSDVFYFKQRNVIIEYL